jgi:glycosyltransferase involved in cell wall biosynthesis
MLEFALRLLRSGRTCFRGTAPRPAAIIGSSPHPLTPLVGWWLARRFRIPFILEVRDLWPETFVGFRYYGPRHPVVWGLRVLERFLYRRANRIITLMPEAWQYIETQASVSREKVVWIPNGAHVGEDAPRRSDGEPPRPFTVMYVGAHGRANVLEDLLLAASFLQERGSDVQFELVGSGKEKDRLIKRSQDLGLVNLRFLDSVPRTQVEATLARADALAALLEDTKLYRYGVSLNKLFDYMASGKPVILAGNPAHNYIDLARCGITVPPRDPQRLAEAITALAEMPAEARREMGERGREYVRRHHDWDLLADRLARTLRDLMSKEEA